MKTKFAMIALAAVLASSMALAQEVDPNVTIDELLVPQQEDFTGPRFSARSVVVPPPEEVPAPATLALIGLGLVGAGVTARRKRT